MLNRKSTTTHNRKRRQKRRQRAADAAFVSLKNKLLAKPATCQCAGHNSVRVPGQEPRLERCKVRVNASTATLAANKSGAVLVCPAHRPER